MPAAGMSGGVTRADAGAAGSAGVAGKAGDAGLVLCAGIPRSGSTWLYNAARLLLERAGPLRSGWIEDTGREAAGDRPALIKLHEFDAGLARRAAAVLTSRRDLVEIATSAHRLGWVSGRDETLAFVEHVAGLHGMWAAFSTLEVSYGDLRKDPACTLARVAEALGLEADAERNAAVLAEIDAARYEGPAGSYDRQTLLHPRHIGDGTHRLDDAVRDEIRARFPSGLLPARVIQETTGRDQVLARAEGRTRADEQLAEANADRAALRQTIQEAARRLLGSVPEGDASLALGEASNKAMHERAAAEREIGRLRAVEARQAAVGAENSAYLARLAEALGDDEPAGPPLGQQEVIERIERLRADLAEKSVRAVRLEEAASAARGELERARQTLADMQSFASTAGGVLARLMRLPGGRGLVRAVEPGRAPWLATFGEDLVRVRKAGLPASPGPIGEGDTSTIDAEPIAADVDGPLISVIICTHNPRRDLLEWTLDSIRAQTLGRACFEMIVVDNNSDPALDAGELDPDGGLGLKVVREERPGLTFARIGGLNAAKADLLVYVDDDNALAPDYLERSIRIARAEPRIGSFGGIAEAVLEAEPAGWVRDLIPHLGVRDHGPEVITSDAAHWGEWDPIGAGMVVRRKVAERYAEIVESTATAGGLGRQGSVQLSGEDTLMNRCANLEGFACSYQPSLKLRHFMKAGRLTGRNIRKTIEGHGRSYVVLERTLGREVEPIRGLARLRWLAQRAVLRAPSGIAKGYALWRWDVGFARASAEPRASAKPVGTKG